MTSIVATTLATVMGNIRKNNIKSILDALMDEWDSFEEQERKDLMKSFELGFINLFKSENADEAVCMLCHMTRHTPFYKKAYPVLKEILTDNSMIPELEDIREAAVKFKEEFCLKKVLKYVFSDMINGFVKELIAPSGHNKEVN